MKDSIINEASQKYNFTNDGGVDNTILFLKNINGLWTIRLVAHQTPSQTTENNIHA